MTEADLRQLFQEMGVLIDDIFYLHPDLLHPWRLDRTSGRPYYSVTGGGRVYLHRLIAGAEPGDGCEVHHKNENRLDCRYDNLVKLPRYQHRREHHPFPGITYRPQRRGPRKYQVRSRGVHIAWVESHTEGERVLFCFTRHGPSCRCWERMRPVAEDPKMPAIEQAMAASRLLPEDRRELALLDAEIEQLQKLRTRLFVERAERHEISRQNAEATHRSWTPRVISGK